MRVFWATILGALLAQSAVAATVEVQLIGLTFSPNDITIEAGDTVRWVNNSGVHDVLADNGSFSSGFARQGPWEFEHTFNDPGEVRYYCSVHSGPGLNINQFMNGRINVQAVTPPDPQFQINQGIAGIWFNPAAGGQGFAIDLRPSDKFIFIGWFTYDALGGGAGGSAAIVGARDQRWLTAQGNYDGGSAQLPLLSNTGGLFNNAQPSTLSQVGTFNISFSSCTAGTVTYNLPGSNLSGSFSIQRALAGTESICLAQATP